MWFVVALPVYFVTELGWQSSTVGTFMAVWVILYGLVQANAPKVTGRDMALTQSKQSALSWVTTLAIIPAMIVLGLDSSLSSELILVGGLLIFGAVFAINSSLHSYLIVRCADSDGVSMDVGFYYMANAAGRLTGTILSGVVFQYYGLSACLLVSSLMLGIAIVLTKRL